MFDAKNLSNNEKLICLILLSFAWSCEKIFPSQEKLGEMSSLTTRTVRTCCEKLEEKGFIERKGFKRKGQGWNGTEYLLQLPPGFDAENDDYINDKLNERETFREQNWTGYQPQEY